jgi:site-specific DNA recombinase
LHALQRAQGGCWLPQELQARPEHLRQARVSLEHQVERLTEAYLAGVGPREEYQRRRYELEHRLESRAAQVRQLEASATKHVERAGIAPSMEAFCQRVSCGLEQADFEQKRQLIDRLSDRVVLTNEEVEIRSGIPTSPSSEQTPAC